MHWAQDIRTLRDGCVHHGHESFVFYGETELYLDPSAHRPPPRQRVLPDRFYESSDPNNLIIVAPALALRRILSQPAQQRLFDDYRILLLPDQR
jgi:hypothetical protein